MTHRIAALGLLLFLGCAGSIAAAEPSVPDLGVVINLDGDDAYLGQTPAESAEILRAEMDRYKDAGMGTIVYSLGQGSDIMLYPTKVADIYGWQKTKHDDDPKMGPRIARNRANIEAGGDAIRVAGEQAKKNGMHFIPSLRMNDGHYAFATPPEESPFAGSFYVENRDLAIGQSPIRAKAEYGQLLDFSHAKVRAHRMAQIMEAIDRYHDLMDGFELDFTRFQVFFPPGKAEVGAPLITEMIRQVRARLDTLGAAAGKRYWLIARVPPSPANCRWSGLEVERWAKEKLVDVLVPSHMMTMAPDMPIGAFKKITEGTNTKVYATMMPRVGWRWEGPADALGSPTRDISPAQVRASAMTLTDAGADGLYLFNFHYYPLWRGQPIDGEGQRLIRELGDAATMARHPLTFSVSKSYWQDHEDSYEYSKTIPAPLEPGAAKSFDLLVGADPSRHGAATLRIGFREVKPGMRLTAKLNGADVFTGDLKERAVTAAPDDGSPNARKVNSTKDLAMYVLDVPLGGEAAARRGRNEITLGIEGDAAVMLTDIELHLAAPE